MTKKDLERENKYLKLQLDKIAELSQINSFFKNETDIAIKIGKIIHLSTSYKDNLDFIKRFDCPYNFFEN